MTLYLSCTFSEYFSTNQTHQKPAEESQDIHIEQSFNTKKRLEIERWLVRLPDGLWQQELTHITMMLPEPDSLPPVNNTGDWSLTAVPSGTRDVKGDGNCLFRCLSYVVTGAEGWHKLFRGKITKTLEKPEVWSRPEIQQAAKLHFMDKTGSPRRGLRNLSLSPGKYLQECLTHIEDTFAGSTELHAAAILLKTPIKVKIR